MITNDTSMNAMNPHINEFVSEGEAGAASVVGVVKKSGKITGYRLSDGSQITKEQGVEMAKNNKIKGVGVASNQGTEYLRALPDGNEQNNLSNLPTITG